MQTKRNLASVYLVLYEWTSVISVYLVLYEWAFVMSLK